MTDWNKLKVVDLKAELKNRGLATTGLKPALVARLEEAENHEGSESEATIQGEARKQDASSAASPDTISPVLPPSGVSAEVVPDGPISTPDVAEPSQIDTPENAPEKIEKLAQEPASIAESASNLESESSVQKDKHSSALPSVEPQEVMEDRQKRKRRSQSPPPSASDTARKRFRADEGAAIPLETQDDSARPDKQGDMELDATESAEKLKEANSDTAMKGAHVGAAQIESNEAADQMDTDSTARTRDSRYKDLFTADKPNGFAFSSSKSRDPAYEENEAEPDRSVPPAIHPATSALYIRDFMRPLNPRDLKSHLTSLATAPGSEVDSEVILNFYLDPIRTHAFILFTNTSAASRVRNALHGATWPEEKTRKPLWVDFIPVENVEEWIAKEQENVRGPRSQKKWEVEYHTGEDRFVTVTLQESGTRSLQQQSSSSAPSHPALAAGFENVPTGPREPYTHPQRAATNLKQLDELFSSTTAKPVLYYKPVDKRLADRRLDNIERALSKDAAAGRRIGGDINRYTFEDDEVLVDRGPEIFPGIRPPPGFRGPTFGNGRGRGGGRRGGGYPSAGRYDSYTGGRRNSRY